MPRKSRTKFPVWYKMLIAIIPIVAFAAICVALALGVQVSPFVVVPIVSMIGTIVVYILGMA